MKTTTFTFFFMFVAILTVQAQTHWSKAIDARHDSILANITGVNGARQKCVSITSFNPKPQTSDLKPAFDKAMKKAAKTPGGLHIIVPKGDWHVKGPIHLVSNVTIELQEGARLLFSDDAKDYLPTVKTSWEGNFCQNYSPFIYGYELENVAIIGKGTIDGNCVNPSLHGDRTRKKTRWGCVRSAMTMYHTQSVTMVRDIFCVPICCNCLDAGM